MDLNYLGGSVREEGGRLAFTEAGRERDQLWGGRGGGQKTRREGFLASHPRADEKRINRDWGRESRISRKKNTQMKTWVREGKIICFSSFGFILWHKKSDSYHNRRLNHSCNWICWWNGCSGCGFKENSLPRCEETQVFFCSSSQLTVTDGQSGPVAGRWMSLIGPFQSIS